MEATIIIVSLLVAAGCLGLLYWAWGDFGRGESFEERLRRSTRYDL